MASSKLQNPRAYRHAVAVEQERRYASDLVVLVALVLCSGALLTLLAVLP